MLVLISGNNFAKSSDDKFKIIMVEKPKMKILIRLKA